MNRLICPECNQPSYCASLTGPLHCANDECGTLLLPGGEVDTPADRRLLPRVTNASRLTVEFLEGDRRSVESDRPLVDVSLIGFSTVLETYPPIGSDVVVELADAGPDGRPWRVRGVVREVQPAEEEGFRVGIEVRVHEVATPDR